MPLTPPQAYRKTLYTHRRGTRANQPLAADVLPGTLYYVTDEDVIERSTGAAWEQYSVKPTRNNLITTTTAGITLKNDTAATLAIPRQISPGLEFSGNSWDTNSNVSRNPKVIIYNKPSTDTDPFPGLYFAFDVGAGYSDQMLFGSANNDAGAVNFRLGGAVNIIFSRSGRGISFVANPLTDAIDTTFTIMGDVSGSNKRIVFTTVPGYVFIQGNNFGFGAGAIPMMDFRGFDDSVSSAIVQIRFRSTPGGAAANGFGSGCLYQANSSTTADQNQGRFDCVWTDVTHATRSAAFDVYLVNNAAALARTYRFLPTGEFQLLAAGIVAFAGRSRITSPADSELLLTDNAASAFSLLKFGGTTSSFVALKRNAAVLETKLGDDSAYAQHKALEFSGSSANFLMRTSVAWNNGAAANLGTLTNAPTAGDPTKWIPVDDNGTTRYIPAW